MIGRAECHVWVEVPCDWWTRVTVLIEMFRDWLILNLILITVFCDWSIRINCYGRGWFCFWRELRHEPGRSLCLLCSVEKDICEIRKLPFINQDEMDIFSCLCTCVCDIYIFPVTFFIQLQNLGRGRHCIQTAVLGRNKVCLNKFIIRMNFTDIWIM